MRAISTIVAIFFILAAGCLVFSCKQRAPETQESEVTTEDVKKEVKEAAETAEQYATQKKKEYRRKAEEDFAEMEKRIDVLNGKIEDLGEKAEPDMRAALEGLKEKRAVLRERLDDIEKSSKLALEDIREGIDSAMKDLEAAYQKAESRFEEGGGIEKE